MRLKGVEVKEWGKDEKYRPEKCAEWENERPKVYQARTISHLSNTEPEFESQRKRAGTKRLYQTWEV